MPDWAGLVGQLSGRRLVVVGDITLDEYLFGRATRLSREAPIPVLEFLRRETILGGAANPARTAAALGAQVRQIGVIGDDAEGTQVRALFQAAGIDDRGLVISGSRRTTCKTRILADESPRLAQQVARLDRLDRHTLRADEQAAVIGAVAGAIDGAAALICSDYQLGVCSAEVVAEIGRLCRQHGVRFCVDAQGNADYYHGADLFRCNDGEAAATLGYSLNGDAALERGLTELRERLAANLIIVTRGPAGLAMIGVDQPFLSLPAHRVSEVYDTVGAGDTFIAVATLGLAAGLAPRTAAELAGAAAALVVRRVGNAIVTPQELAATLRDNPPGTD
jgi:D-glycero-beta-D-manno-heptose-7-phosphate kinase